MQCLSKTIVLCKVDLMVEITTTLYIFSLQKYESEFEGGQNTEYIFEKAFKMRELIQHSYIYCKDGALSNQYDAIFYL